MHGGDFWSAAWKAAAVSVASTAIPFGVGQVFGHQVGTLGNELLRAGAHGLGNGLLNVAEGGKFGAGFATGLAASFAGSAAQHFKFSSMGIVGSTTLAGAGAAALSGGDWMVGAMQGMNIGTFNHGWAKSSYDGAWTYELDDVEVIGHRSWINAFQTGLDVAGIADPTGLVDLGNGLIYAFRGQWGNALVSAAGIIPYVGDVGKAGRLGTEAFRAAKGVTQVEKSVFTVTKEGVVLPKGAKIPGEFVQNPYRSSSYGVFENGKFVEKLRIDPATAPGMKGPNYSHFHLNGSGKHSTGNWPWW